MANEVPIELKLLGQSQSILDEIQGLSKGITVNINEINIDTSSLTKQIEQSLASTVFKINIQASDQSLANLSSSITKSIGAVQINSIQVNTEALSGLTNSIAGAVKAGVAKGTYLGPDIDGTNPLQLSKLRDASAYSTQLAGVLPSQNQALGLDLARQQLGGFNNRIEQRIAGGLPSQDDAQSLSTVRSQIAQFNIAKDRLLAEQLQSRLPSQSQFIPLSGVNSALQGFNEDELDQKNRVLQDAEFQRQVKARNQLQKEVGKRGFIESFDHDDFVSNRAQELGISDQSLLNPITKRPVFDSGRLTDRFTQLQIGRNAAETLAFQGPVQGVGSLLGGLAGGSIAGGAGASTGAFIGTSVAGAAVAAFDKLKDSLIEAAQAGLTLQRSILAISGSLLETTRVIDKTTGKPLDTLDQLEFDRKKAADIQTKSRAAAASVGIGGETESNLVQSILLGAGNRGITLSADQSALLTQRFGAAINLLAPDLLSNPTRTRKDVSDVVGGSSTALNTTLGIRLGPALKEIGQAGSADELIRATEALQKLVDTFKNSDQAISQISVLNSSIERSQQDIGKAFVDQLGPGLKEINKIVSDPNFSKGLQNVAAGLGSVLDKVLVEGAKSAKPIGETLGALGKLASPFKASDAGTEIGNQITKQVLNLFKKPEVNQNSANQNSIRNLEEVVAPQTFIDSAFEAATGSKLKSLKELEQGSPLVEIFGGQKLLDNRDQSSPLDTQNLIQGGNLLSKGLEGKRDLTASLFGSDLIGSISGLRSKFSGEGSFANQIATQTSVSEGLRKKLDNLPPQDPKSALAGDRLNTLAALASSEQKLQQIRNSQFETINGLAEKEKQFGDLRAQGVDTTSFAGKRAAAQLQIQSLDNQISELGGNQDNLTEDEKRTNDLRRNVLRARKSEAQSNEKLQPFRDAQQGVTLTKSLLSTQEAIEETPFRLKDLNLAIQETVISFQQLDKQNELSRLQGADKATALIKDFQSRGGVVDIETQQRLDKIYGTGLSTDIQSEGSFGSGLGTELRQRKESGLNLDLFLGSEEGRVVGQQRKEQQFAIQDIHQRFEGKQLSADAIGNQLQSAIISGQLAQLYPGSQFSKIAEQQAKTLSRFQDKDRNIGGDTIAGFSGLINPSSVKLPSNPSQSLADAASAMTDLVKTFSVANLSKAIAESIIQSTLVGDHN
jgi:hypothetical protein